MFSSCYILIMRTPPEEFKEKYLHIRIKESEKKEMLEVAKEEGFTRLTDFILWLYRQFKKKK